MIVFISGGAKNGKSSLAQDLAVKLAGDGKHYYIATMIPSDQEDLDRIRHHRDDREGMGFETVECGKDILSCLERVEANATFLLDSATALLLNELFPDPVGCEMDLAAAERCANDLVTFATSVGNLVIVSDYIYSDAARYDALTRTYQACLARIDRKLAQVSDMVIEVAAGICTLHKGVLPT